MATEHEKTPGSTRTSSPRSASAETKPTRQSSQPAARARSSRASVTAEQIAERAKSIWKQRGCRPGEDERNWYDAENQLKREAGG